MRFEILGTEETYRSNPRKQWYRYVVIDNDLAEVVAYVKTWARAVKEQRAYEREALEDEGSG